MSHINFINKKTLFDEKLLYIVNILYTNTQTQIKSLSH